MKPWRWILFVMMLGFFGYYAYQQRPAFDTISLITGFFVGLLFSLTICYVVFWVLLEHRTKQLELQYSQLHNDLLRGYAKERGKLPMGLREKVTEQPLAAPLPPPPPRLLAARKIDGDPDTPGNFRVIGELGGDW